MKIMGIKLPGPFATIYSCDHQADEVAAHTHGYPHSCTVISGSVLATCDGKEKTLTVGQSVIFPAGLVHSIKPLSVGTTFINATAEVLPSEEPQFTEL